MPLAEAGTRYTFCSKARTWSDAQQRCQQLGARLVRIDDAAENKMVQDVGMTVWIGGTDEAQVTYWRWPDGDLFWIGLAGGSPVDGRYVNWAATKPDLRLERCAALLASSGQWDDLVCTSPLPLVCETY